jgi:hypothetical protein
MAKNSKRRAWTSVQVRELKTLAKKKTPAVRIARTLKRTVGATRHLVLAVPFLLHLVPRDHPAESVIVVAYPWCFAALWHSLYPRCRFR